MTPIEKKVSMKKITRSTLASPIAAARLPDDAGCGPERERQRDQERRDEAENEFRESLPDFAELRLLPRPPAD